MLGKVQGGPFRFENEKKHVHFGSLSCNLSLQIAELAISILTSRRRTSTIHILSLRELQSMQDARTAGTAQGNKNFLRFAQKEFCPDKAFSASAISRLQVIWLRQSRYCDLLIIRFCDIFHSYFLLRTSKQYFFPHYSSPLLVQVRICIFLYFVFIIFL